jgi:cell wall-associated NlpC family hydrolase
VTSFDPRLTPARPDLAAKSLEGRVSAARFVDGAEAEVIDPQAPLRRAPSHEAPLDTEALKGERVTVYETNDEGWCWGQLDSDGYVGWLPAGALAKPGARPTHKVSVPRTLVFPAADIKQPPVASMPFGARLAIARMDERFAVTPDGGFIPARHVSKIEAQESDFVAVAERFLAAPYLWGGKTSLGIDCSGLVQVALNACGIPCLRDSDMQEKNTGARIDAGLGNLQRGDLVFWKGHVAIARDNTTILHANAFHMAVAVESVAGGDRAYPRGRIRGHQHAARRCLSMRVCRSCASTAPCIAGCCGRDGR